MGRPVPNPSYQKGYRNECKIRRDFEDAGYGVERAHQSGAYTGEPDLKVLIEGRYWTIDCKCGADWKMKRHRARLEKADVCVDTTDREIPLATLPLAKLLELIKVVA
jgi:Holliday junction resolvase